MKNFICIIFVIFSFTVYAQQTIGKYKKIELPEGFHYNVVRDKSDSEKNELHVVINMKLSVGQIAMLASNLYNTKPKKQKFFIYYHYFLNVIANKPWAQSNFSPKLKIKIFN